MTEIKMKTVAHEKVERKDFDPYKAVLEMTHDGAYDDVINALLSLEAITPEGKFRVV